MHTGCHYSSAGKTTNVAQARQKEVCPAVQIHARQSAAYLMPVTLLTGTARQKVVAAKMPRIDVVAQCELSTASCFRPCRTQMPLLKHCARSVAVEQGRGQRVAGIRALVAVQPAISLVMLRQAGDARSTWVFPRRWQRSSARSAGKSTSPGPSAHEVMVASSPVVPCTFPQHGYMLVGP